MSAGERLARKFYDEDCHFLCNLEGSAAIVMVLSLYAYTYYGFIWLMVLPIMAEHAIFAKSILFLFHALFAMTLCCWIQAMMTHPGSPTHEV